MSETPDYSKFIVTEILRVNPGRVTLTSDKFQNGLTSCEFGKYTDGQRVSVSISPLVASNLLAYMAISESADSVPTVDMLCVDTSIGDEYYCTMKFDQRVDFINNAGTMNRIAEFRIISAVKTNQPPSPRSEHPLQYTFIRPYSNDNTEGKILGLLAVQCGMDVSLSVDLTPYITDVLVQFKARRGMTPGELTTIRYDYQNALNTIYGKAIRSITKYDGTIDLIVVQVVVNHTDRTAIIQHHRDSVNMTSLTPDGYTFQRIPYDDTCSSFPISYDLACKLLDRDTPKEH